MQKIHIKIKMAYNFRRLITDYPDESSAVEFFRTRGLLHDQRECKLCGTMMRLSYRTQNDKQIPVWRCTSKPCKSTLGLRVDTWFHPSTLDFDKIMQFIYWWSHGKTSISFCERELEIGHCTVIDWNMYMREVPYIFMEQ